MSEDGSYLEKRLAEISLEPSGKPAHPSRKGRSRHQPTSEQRAQVEILAAVGTRHEDIAALVGVQLRTLVKCYKKELALGKAKAIFEMGKTLFKMAKNGNTAACIFFLKAQGGWRETQVIETPDKKPDSPLVNVWVSNRDPQAAADAYAELMASQPTGYQYRPKEKQPH